MSSFASVVQAPLWEQYQLLKLQQSNNAFITVSAPLRRRPSKWKLQSLCSNFVFTCMVLRECGFQYGLTEQIFFRGVLNDGVGLLKFSMLIVWPPEVLFHLLNEVVPSWKFMGLRAILKAVWSLDVYSHCHEQGSRVWCPQKMVFSFGQYSCLADLQFCFLRFQLPMAKYEHKT